MNNVQLFIFLLIMLEIMLEKKLYYYLFPICALLSCIIFSEL